jgi:hypothetical protein
MATQLVMDGLKLITCGNGFVEGEIQLYKPMLFYDG